MPVAALREVAKKIGETNRGNAQFRQAANENNKLLSNIVKDISNSFRSQRRDVIGLNNSIQESIEASQATASKIDNTNSYLQDSISLQNVMVGELKNIRIGIRSLNESIQALGQLQVSNIVGGAAGAAAAGAAGAAAGGGGRFGAASKLFVGAASVFGAGVLAEKFLFGSDKAGDSGSGTTPNALPSGGNRDTSSRNGSTKSVAELVRLAKSAGFSDTEAPIMAAIAAAESSGNPRAHNPNTRTGDNSYGLWQINMLGRMGPERRRQFGIQSDEELFDPEVNAKAARKIFEQQGFKAWSVYKSGAYLPFLGTAQRTSGNLTNSTSGQTSTSTISQTSPTPPQTGGGQATSFPPSNSQVATPVTPPPSAGGLSPAAGYQPPSIPQQNSESAESGGNREGPTGNQQQNGGGRVLQQQNGIRNLPISERLLGVLQQAARTAGVDVVVTSGGQPPYPQGPRTGRTRHDNGNAADLDLYSGGKILSDSNPADVELKKKFVSAATAAGATGIGAGYMGPTKMHVGFGTPAKWGGAPWLGGVSVASEDASKSGGESVSGSGTGGYGSAQGIGGRMSPMESAIMGGVGMANPLAALGGMIGGAQGAAIGGLLGMGAGLLNNMIGGGQGVMPQTQPSNTSDNLRQIISEAQERKPEDVSHAETFRSLAASEKLMADQQRLQSIQQSAIEREMPPRPSPGPNFEETAPSSEPSPNINIASNREDISPYADWGTRLMAHFGVNQQLGNIG
jgi:hypothetical protein